MPKVTSAELYVRLTREDAAGDTHLVEFPIDPSIKWDELWQVAHSGAHGVVPPPQMIGAYMWSAANQLRDAEKKLDELCGEKTS